MIRHLKCNKEMTFNEQFKQKWKEQIRISLGVYEPIINLKKLFN